MMIKDLTSISDTVFDMVDNVGLVLERMTAINGVIIDALTPLCSLESDASMEQRGNSYNLVNRQSSLLVMASIMDECIEKLSTELDVLGEISSRLNSENVVSE